MTDKHDFEDALLEFNSWLEFDCDKNEYFASEHGHVMLDVNQTAAIQTALRIAGRLQSGEPSGAVLDSLHALYDENDDCLIKGLREDKFKEIFKPMAAQLFKEGE